MHPLTRHKIIQACFLPKGSYAYPSSVIILWSEICIQNFLCVWVNETSEHTSWEKSTALKDRDQTEMIGFDCICLYRTRHVLHGISPVLQADRSLHGARNRLLYDLNNQLNGWGRGLSCSRCQVASWVVKQSTYATFRRFSKADEIGMQTNPERGKTGSAASHAKQRGPEPSLERGALQQTS